MANGVKPNLSSMYSFGKPWAAAAPWGSASGGVGSGVASKVGGSALGKAAGFLGSAGAVPVVGGIVSGVTGWLKARAMKQAEEVKARHARRAADIEAQDELFNRRMFAQEQERVNPRQMLANNALQWMVKDTGALDDDQTYFDYSESTWDPSYVLTADEGRLARRAAAADRRQSTPDGYKDTYMSPPPRDAFMSPQRGRGQRGLNMGALVGSRGFLPRTPPPRGRTLGSLRDFGASTRNREAERQAMMARGDRQFQNSVSNYRNRGRIPVDAGMVAESTTIGPRGVTTQAAAFEEVPRFRASRPGVPRGLSMAGLAHPRWRA
jgi:hypothetical protein